MTNFETVYKPYIDHFIENIHQLEESNESVKECIVKFDQDLSLKCNKSAFQTFKFELARDFMTIDMHPVIIEQISEVRKMVMECDSTLDKSLSSYRRNMKKIVDDSIADRIDQNFT